MQMWENDFRDLGRGDSREGSIKELWAANLFWENVELERLEDLVSSSFGLHIDKGKT